jgi:hypothetical protein
MSHLIANGYVTPPGIDGHCIKPLTEYELSKCLRKKRRIEKTTVKRTSHEKTTMPYMSLSKNPCVYVIKQ